MIAAVYQTFGKLATDGAPIDTDATETGSATDGAQMSTDERQIRARLSVIICAPSVANEFSFIGDHRCPIGG
jgi:hypothetical protein